MVAVIGLSPELCLQVDAFICLSVGAVKRGGVVCGASAKQ